MKRATVMAAGVFVLWMIGILGLSPAAASLTVERILVPDFVFDPAQTNGSNVILDPKIVLRMHGEGLVANAIEFNPEHEHAWSLSPVSISGAALHLWFWNSAKHLEELQPQLDNPGNWPVFGQQLVARMDGPRIQISFKGTTKTVDTTVCGNPDRATILVNLVHQSIYLNGKEAYLPFTCNDPSGQWVFVIKLTEASVSPKEPVAQ